MHPCLWSDFLPSLPGASEGVRVQPSSILVLLGAHHPGQSCPSYVRALCLKDTNS